jgi:hypothetical protein
MDRIMVAATIAMTIVFGGFMVGVIAMAFMSTRKKDKRPVDVTACDNTARDNAELDGVAFVGILPREAEAARH